jgi:hypothetical protein
MGDSNTTTRTLEADEDILTYTFSDEAIEAAASIERPFTIIGCNSVFACADVAPRPRRSE